MDDIFFPRDDNGVILRENDFVLLILIPRKDEDDIGKPKKLRVWYNSTMSAWMFGFFTMCQMGLIYGKREEYKIIKYQDGMEHDPLDTDGLYRIYNE